MCVIALFKKSKPTEEIIKQMSSINKDGAGVAWREDGVVNWRKGLSNETLFRITKELKLPFVVHFRFGTVGKNSKHLTHPFPVSKDIELDVVGSGKDVIFHNGHWEGWRDYCLGYIQTRSIRLPKGDFSDSRAIAWMVYHYGFEFLKLLPDTNKFIVMTPKHLWSSGDFKEKDGNWYSNLYWERTEVVTRYGWNADTQSWNKPSDDEKETKDEVVDGKTVEDTYGDEIFRSRENEYSV